MNLNAETYNLLMSVMGAYFQAMGVVRSKLPEQPPAPPPLLTIRGGYAESPAWYMVQAAEFAPEPLTVKGLRVRDIYASEKIASALLDMLASEQWLDRRGNQYYLTEAGKQIIQGMKQRPEKYLADLTPLPIEDIGRAERFLRRIIDASLSAPTPPSTWCLAHSRNRAPDDSSSPLIKIFHYLSDFNAFRDDAHMAAFMPKESIGYIWEAFTFVADGAADSASTLFSKLAYRGYSEEEFEEALRKLNSKGWLKQDGSGGPHRITDEGAKVRNEIERLTDRYFYAPWSALNTGEVDELHGLLNRLQEALLATE